MLSDIKTFTLVVSTGGVIITAILTHYFTIKKEKFSKTFEYKIKILKEVYAPIYRILVKNIHPFDGYEGITVKSFKEIDQIFEEKVELIDPILEEFIWILKEECYLNQNHPKGEWVQVDQDKKFLNYVQYQYNNLRKEMNLPYDYAEVSFDIKLKVHLDAFMRNRKRKEAKKLKTN
ncbi:hypothetical protein ACFQZ1_08000 [Bacillus sp. CGMCC 1.60114]|uniref:hypothetical protein n=1 Tax=unclassified Bacillus (in: firmicutes) TaxID=185979 RepID=UPI003626AFEC